MKGIRFKRAIWEVARIEQDENGFDDGYAECGLFWSEAEAIAERNRLQAANTDPSSRYEVLEHVASGVYPDDELPPWIDDPDRLTRRGYEDQA